jgi:50S ribosomal protein L16 3-hydroxylase
VIEQILGDLPPRKFLDQFYTRLPHSRPGGAAGLTSFAGWAPVEAILQAKGVDAFLAREGLLWEEGRRPSSGQARELFGQGYTLVIRSAEKHDAELARLARGFGEDLASPVNVHVYSTPPGRSGFGWHYDPEDVFIVRRRGRKSTG